jgi:flagellar biosynthesis GTPase FlhF
MNIINSVTGLNINLNLREMNNPNNIIVQRINYNNDNEEEDEDEEDEDEEDEEEEDEEEEEEEDGENNENDENEENEEENDDGKEENSNEENEENEINEINDENNEVQIYFNKRKKFILELNEFQYKHIKKYSSIKEKKCSICLNKYKSPDIIKEFPCKHIFHKTCILKWLKNSDRCPICKYDISNDINNMDFDKLISDDEKEDES